MGMDFLDYVMCRVPDPDDAKYKDDEDAYEDDLEEMQTKTDATKPKEFPYTFYLMDEKQEKAYDEPMENFQPENMANLIYTSLSPLKIYEGGDKPLTPKLLCEGVAKVGFVPGEHCFLENIQIQMREYNGVEAMTVVFYAGPEQ